ncbi:transcriptional regulator [Campylobacter devanensis]|uniref:transcriptional regulator n=1 Tax=Campylobacter devanensis TaxID=3161138 RepID=UPI000A33CBE3|nr:transcriptional regulator [Campylobacter sp. P0187]
MLNEEQILEAYKVIGQNVAKVRKERKVSQLSLSLDMGYKSVSVVSFVEISLKGAYFNIAHLLQISTILNVSLIEQLSN